MIFQNTAALLCPSTKSLYAHKTPVQTVIPEMSGKIHFGLLLMVNIGKLMTIMKHKKYSNFHDNSE